GRSGELLREEPRHVAHDRSGARLCREEARHRARESADLARSGSAWSRRRRRSRHREGLARETKARFLAESPRVWSQVAERNLGRRRERYGQIAAREVRTDRIRDAASAPRYGRAPEQVGR